MFLRKWSLLFLVVILLCPAISWAAESLPGMYKINYKLVFLFHPLMANFDLQLGRHLRSDVSFDDTKSQKKIQDEMAALNKGARLAIEELQRKIERLQVDMNNLDSRKKGLVETKIISSSSGQKGAEPSRPRPPRSTKEEPAVGVASEPWKDVMTAKEELRQRIEELKKAQGQAYDTVYDPMYVSRTTSEETVKRAQKEITDLLESFSREHGNAAIVDSDYVLSTATPVEFHSTLANCFNFLTIGLRQKLLDFNLSFNEAIPPRYAATPESKSMYIEAMVKPGKLDEMVSRTITKMPWVEAALGARGRLFLVGGENADITKDILKALFAKHKVKDDVAKRILELIPAN